MNEHCCKETDLFKSQNQKNVDQEFHLKNRTFKHSLWIISNSFKCISTLYGIHIDENVFSILQMWERKENQFSSILSSFQFCLKIIFYIVKFFLSIFMHHDRNNLTEISRRTWNLRHNVLQENDIQWKKRLQYLIYKKSHRQKEFKTKTYWLFKLYAI